jgi:hypothetical protein
VSVAPELEVKPEAHVHRWRVVAYEWQSQLVAYRCECGAERFERPEPEERER